MPFTFEPVEPLSEIILVTPRIFSDDRGSFFESYKHSDFMAAGITELFVQDNVSISGPNVIRGLHFQKEPAAQGKLVSVVKGEIFDVAVDIRKNSLTFKRWVSATLSAENKKMLYVPPGFAHGFAVMSDSAEVHYKCTNEYSPPNERGITWNDPEIGIDWPVNKPVLSEKDSLNPPLKEAGI